MYSADTSDVIRLTLFFKNSPHCSSVVWVSVSLFAVLIVAQWYECLPDAQLISAYFNSDANITINKNALIASLKKENL